MLGSVKCVKFYSGIRQKVSSSGTQQSNVDKSNIQFVPSFHFKLTEQLWSAYNIKFLLENDFKVTDKINETH